MHPAVRSHINGNLSIIRTCLAQIEAAMSAEDLGHPTSQALGARREEKEKRGAATPYLEPEAEKMRADGLADLFTEAQQDGVVNETVENTPE